MNFSYLYLDEQSLSYAGVLEKVMLSGQDGAEVNPSDYQNFNGYQDTAKSSYYDVNLSFLFIFLENCSICKNSCRLLQFYNHKGFKGTNAKNSWRIFN